MGIHVPYLCFIAISVREMGNGARPGVVDSLIGIFYQINEGHMCHMTQI